MKINTLVNEKDKLKIEIQGESTTLTNLIAKQVWSEGGEAAAIKEHPFLAEPKILVTGKDPLKILEKSTKAVEAQCEDFEAELKKVLKK